MFGKIKTAALVCLLAFSAPGYSDDVNRDFYGYGSLSCGIWHEIRQNWKTKTNANAFGAAFWISGYITAYNTMTPDTWDILGNTDMDSVYLWIDKFCQENPLGHLASAMQDLTDELYPNRTVKAPESN